MTYDEWQQLGLMVGEDELRPSLYQDFMAGFFKTYHVTQTSSYEVIGVFDWGMRLTIGKFPTEEQANLAALTLRMTGR